MPLLESYTGVGKPNTRQTVFPEKGLGDNLPFLFACHREWERMGKGIIPADFREKILYRDVEMEIKLRRLDDWIQHYKDTR